MGSEHLSGGFASRAVSTTTVFRRGSLVSCLPMLVLQLIKSETHVMDLFGEMINPP